ncbi:tRNA (cytosine(34)-C(5))-methyltransferase-like [Centruroides sculpturatus]|uniref:tRNA (cytosine(34)-C(5))-methyltransferase-like n=1 Tax=Centruroides sculpturatus TaxID=218467 RepID=UPI000C6EF5B0|nr:tRNA (cytosine(34)-C(5))-methyltransferase-like [Centruroides sculpturatus]
MPRNRKKKRQKIGVKTCGDPNKGHVAGKRPVGYSDIIKENASFERYYKEQHIVPEEEWEMFMAALRDNLPTAFRITGYRGQANALLKVIQGQYFQDLLNVNVEEEEYTKPYCLPCLDGVVVANDVDNKRCYMLVHQAKRLHSPCFIITNHDASQMPNIKINKVMSVKQSFYEIMDKLVASKKDNNFYLNRDKYAKCLEEVKAAKNMKKTSCSLQAYKALRHFDCRQRKKTNCTYEGGEWRNKVTKNRAYHEGIKCFPYEAMFGCPMKMGLATSAIPSDMIRVIRSEEDLEKLLHSHDNTKQKNDVENAIEQDKEESIVKNESEDLDSVELVDTSESLPGLKTSPGLSYWKVMNRELESFDSFDDVPDKYRTQIRPQMFPPAPEIVSKLNLHRCLRILPHHQNTGGFFIAVFKKVKEFLPWESQIKEIVSHKNNDIEEKLSDVIETKDESDKSPPRKKKKIWGYKEDPYIFFKEEGIIWPNIRDFYKLDSFPYKQLLSRCAGERKKNLYFVSEAAKNIVQNNIDFVKIINTGVRVFCRSDNKDAKCNFRLSQEGVPIILPFMEGRILHISLEDLILLLTEEVPLLQKFSDELQKQAALLDSGCAVMIYTANKGTKEEFKIELCGWKGKASVRCYVTKIERIHYLRICGVDVSEFEKKDKKFKIYITKTSEFTEEEDQKKH